MEFNPLIKKKLADVYPKLTQIIGQCEDKMARYVLLMYDLNSPLKSHYPELDKRKQFAANLSGYDKGNLESLFDFRVKVGDDYEPNEVLLDIITNYLKYQNNMVWYMIVSNEQAFYEYNRRVMMPVDGVRDKDILQAVEIKTKIMQSMDDIFNRLQRYTKELSGGDDVLNDLISKKRRVRPEDFANITNV